MVYRTKPYISKIYLFFAYFGTYKFCIVDIFYCLWYTAIVGSARTVSCAFRKRFPHAFGRDAGKRIGAYSLLDASCARKPRRIQRIGTALLMRLARTHGDPAQLQLAVRFAACHGEALPFDGAASPRRRYQIALEVISPMTSGPINRNYWHSGRCFTAKVQAI